jgi:predicted ferric reductase
VQGPSWEVSRNSPPTPLNRAISGFFWIGLYLIVVLLPIFLMLVPPAPSGRGFWLELSLALGFVGLTQIAVQFVLIARFRRITRPYGIDIILKYHRQIAVVAVAFILLHPAIIVIENPSRLRLLNPLSGNIASRLGLVALAALITTVVVSIFRERLRLDYERWRGAHILLAVIAIVFAQAHVSLAGLYTNTAWKHAVWIASAVLMGGLILYLRVVRPLWQRNFRWRVAEVRAELGDTSVLALEPIDHPGLTFSPGQFCWIKLARTPFTIEEHPFSMCSSAERPERLEFGIKALGDFSSAVSDVPHGTRAFVDGPHGAFSIDRYPAVGYVFLAGGAGISPFMSFLHTMADRHDPRPVLLIYAAKSWDDLAFREDIEALREGNQLDLSVEYVLEEAPDGWTGETGFVTAEMLTRILPVEHIRRHYFLCGPPPMMDAVHPALIESGVPAARIQLEKFALV